MTGAIYLNAVAACLPSQRARAADAVADGRYEAKYLETTEYESVAVCRPGRAPVDLALAAARATLAAVPGGAAFDLLTYSSIHRQAHPALWVPGAYLQRALGGSRTLALSIAHGCNAQLIACDVGIGLVAAGRARTALVTGGDVFSGSGFDRWRSDFVAYGDAGSAMLLSPRPGGARVAHLATTSDPALESMHRNAEPFAEQAADHTALAYDVRATKRRFLDEHDGERLIAGTRAAIARLWSEVVQLTGWRPADIRHIVFPNLGIKVLESSYYPALPGAAARSTWSFGRTVGHLGTSDAAVGLAQLATTGQLHRGDRVLLIGAGAGFSWSMLALAIDEPLPAALVDDEAIARSGEAVA